MTWFFGRELIDDNSYNSVQHPMFLFVKSGPFLSRRRRDLLFGRPLMI